MQEAKAQLMEKLEIIDADWPAPDNIVACCTTRSGGISEAGFKSLNLATHVNDNEQRVAINRELLIEKLKLPTAPRWLQQTHSTRVIKLDSDSSDDGDAALTGKQGTVAVVLTADCLPVLICNRQGSEVAAAHAGWRGLLDGVLEQTVLSMASPASELLAWMGPAIGAQQFEVGPEVRDAFIRVDAESGDYFKQNQRGFYLADLYAIARFRLKKLGLNAVYGGDYCTFTEKDRFFSYRREKVTGRQASLIYINKKNGPSR